MKKLIFIWLLCQSICFAQSSANRGHIIDTVSTMATVTNPTMGMEVICLCDSMVRWYDGSKWLIIYDSVHTRRAIIYTSYQGIVTQSGLSAPTVVRKDQNFSGVTFTWARTGIGTYTLTASSPIFVAGNTVLIASQPANLLYKVTYTVTSTTVITISSVLESVISLILSLTNTDGLLNNTLIEVRIYN